MRPRDPRHRPRPAHHGLPRGPRPVRHPQWRPRRGAGRGRFRDPGLPHGPAHPLPLPEGFAETLGAEPLTAFDTGPNVGDLLVEVSDERTVHALRPDLKALGAHSARGVIATARAENPSLGYDFVSRCFFPNVGIDEDPVTGSAHTALAPYWSERLGRTALTGLQASPRSGRVRTELRGERTLLGGRAVTVIEGELQSAALPRGRAMKHGGPTG